MSNYIDKSRGRMIIALGALLAALWMIILYDTIKDAREEYYDVRVSPGAVSYGTHSTASIPFVSSSSHSSGNITSGAAVHNFARYGHGASAGVASSNYKVYTTSSATVHSIGSGGGGGGGQVGSTTTSSARGIRYGSTSAAMPTMAVAMSTSSAKAAAPARYGAGPRKMPGWDGDEGDTEWDEGKWWYWDINTDSWVSDASLDNTYRGLTRNTGSGTEVWDGSKWVTMEEWLNPGVPVGNTPWLMMLLLLAGYGGVKWLKLSKKQHII